MSPTDGRVISNLLTQSIKGLPITIYGNGSQTRSFCYVDDLISGIVLMMDSPPEFSGPVNLGSLQEFSILELLDLIRLCFGHELQVRFLDLPLDDPKMRRPDTSLAERVLGWSARIQLKDGIERTIAYLESVL